MQYLQSPCLNANWSLSSQREKNLKNLAVEVQIIFMQMDEKLWAFQQTLILIISLGPFFFFSGLRSVVDKNSSAEKFWELFFKFIETIIF